MDRRFSEIVKGIGGQVAAICVLSLLLGVVYNAASPLGLERTTAGRKSGANLSEKYVNEPVAVAMENESASGYQNQTLDLKFLPAAGTVAPAANKKFIPTLNWIEVKALLAKGDIILVDARTAAFFQAGHIPGAISLFGGSPASEIQAFAAKYPKAASIVIYCGSTNCPLSHDLADILIAQYGFSNVKLMPGGYAEYRQAESIGGSL